METNLAKKDTTTISHLTGRPVRSLDELYKEIRETYEPWSWINAINEIMQSWAIADGFLDFELSTKVIVNLRILFVELIQNICELDLKVISKSTGKPVRSIRTIENELRHLSELEPLLRTLKDLVYHTMFAHVPLPDIEERRKAEHYFYANEIREIIAEIFINLHNQKS